MITTLLRAYGGHIEEVEWVVAIRAALIAALLFLAVQMCIAVFVQGYGAWLPVRMIAAIALGPGVLAETGQPVGALLVAFLIHFGLSIITAWILAPVVHGQRWSVVLACGLGAGLVIYLVNFYVLIMGFTWFYGIRGIPTLLNHLLFGAALTTLYAWLSTSTGRGSPTP